MQKSTGNKGRIIGAAVLVLTFLTVVSFILVFCTATHVSGGISGDLVLCITPTEGANAPIAADIAMDVNLTSMISISINDNDTIWTTDTRVNIFAQDDPHVGNDGTGDASFVVAPGTSNEYIFILRNNKKAGIRYKVEVKGVSDSGYYIPVNVELVDADQNNLTKGYIDIEDLDLEHGGRLAGYAERAYTLNWVWEYEADDDDHDTMLGDAATLEEIPCGINIRVVAEYDDSPASSDSESGSHDPGDTPVVTGDRTNVLPAVTLAAVCCILVLLALKAGSPKKRTDDAD